MKAVILAGGKGTRLAPFTTVLPKPLMPIGDLPILEIVLRQLASQGFTDVTLSVGHLAELIMAYCGDGQKFDLNLHYSKEDTPLGTAGPIALASGIDSTFLVMNGDLLTDVDYSVMLDHHKRSAAIATMVVFERSVKIDLGVIELDEDGYLSDYIEKPTYEYLVSTGIYIFEPAVLSYIPPNRHYDLPELILALLRDKKRVHSYKHRGHWLDIGRHDDYELATQTFEDHRSDFLPFE